MADFTVKGICDQLSISQATLLQVAA